MKAQQPVSVHLTEKDGLPDKEFYNIIEDSNGFIWLCADKGLFRYDGKIFKNYSNPEKRGLSVFGVKEDQYGRIWSNNITGQFFYLENNILHTFIDLKVQLKGELATFEIKDNFLIVCTQLRIYRVNLDTKKIENVNLSKHGFGNPFSFNSTVYVVNSDSVSAITKNNKFQNILETKLKLRDENGRSNSSGKAEIFKLGTQFFYLQFRQERNAFFKFNVSQKSFDYVDGFEEVAKERIQHVFENEDEVWLSTTSGVWIYKYVEDQFLFQKQLLKGRDISKIIKDKDDNYWITTINSGIYVLPNIYIETYPISENYKNISGIDKINDHTLIFGSNNGGIGFYDTKTNSETLIDIPFKNSVSSLKYDPKKQVSYIGKDRYGFILDHNTLKIEVTPVISSAKSFSILNDDRVLVLNYRSVMLVSQGDFHNFEQISDDSRPYTSYFSRTDNAVFVGKVDDLVKYDSLWKPKIIRHKNTPIYGLSITETKNDIIWVSTFKNGVYGIKNDSVIHHLTKAKGLVSDHIGKIEADDRYLWVTTDSGVQRYHTVTKQYKTLTKRDGIISYDISGIEIFEDKVVFASNVGLFSIDKIKAFKRQTQPEVYFSQVEINQEAVVIKPKYELDYNQNAIKIGFNVNGFQFSQNVKYAIRLLGFDSHWVTTESGRNSMNYNSLPAGNYTFQVKLFLDNNDKGKAEIKTLQFSIKRPFWKTWWFISIVAFLVLSSIVLYFRRKIKKKEQQRQLEVSKLSLDNEMVNLKLENLRSQMNPHFIFNALNSIQEYIVLNQKKLASEFLGKFADLIRTYLNHSTKGNITLQEEIDCLQMYLELEKLRFEDKLQYKIATSGSVNPDQVNIPTMLIQPYVENALKHGLLHRKTGRVLKVDFFINDNTHTVTCMIVDNGVGREQAEKFKARSLKNHESFATKATQDRLVLLNYGKQKQIGVTITDLFGEDAKSSGTQVEVVIPFTTH